MLLSVIRRDPPIPAPECQGGHQWRGCGWNLCGLSPGQGWLDRCSVAGTGTVSFFVSPRSMSIDREKKRKKQSINPYFGQQMKLGIDLFIKNASCLHDVSQIREIHENWSNI